MLHIRHPTKVFVFLQTLVRLLLLLCVVFEHGQIIVGGGKVHSGNFFFSKFSELVFLSLLVSYPKVRKVFLPFFVIASIVITYEKQFSYQYGVFTYYLITKTLSGVKHAEPMSHACQQ